MGLLIAFGLATGQEGDFARDCLDDRAEQRAETHRIALEAHRKHVDVSARHWQGGGMRTTVRPNDRLPVEAERAGPRPAAPRESPSSALPGAGVRAERAGPRPAAPREALES